MSRRNRPTAFSQSFGDSIPDARDVTLDTETPNASNSLYGYGSGSTPTTRSHSMAAPSSSIPRGYTSMTADSSSRATNTAVKRKEGTQRHTISSQPEKRSRVQQAIHRLGNTELDGCLIETRDTLIVGEEEVGEEADHKPVRYLTDFTMFDPTHRNMYVTPDELLEENNNQCEAIGKVGPLYVNEEDAGQDLEAEVDEAKGSGKLNELDIFRTSAISTFSIDYGDHEGAIYLQTNYAFYVLGKPSLGYASIFKQFYRPHRIAQLIISAALRDRVECTRTSFLSEYEGVRDNFLSEVIVEEAVTKAYPTVTAVVKAGGYELARQSPFIQEILADPSSIRRPVQHVPAPRKAPPLRNIDLYVLRPENQNQTVVTPLIGSLSKGLFRESLHVLGGRKSVVQNSESQKSAHSMLVLWLRRALVYKGSVEFGPRAGQAGTCFRNSVRVNHEIYSVGDVVLVPAVTFAGRENLHFPETEAEIKQIPLQHSIADYFWFGRILYINSHDETAHVQYFEHASKTLLQEIHEPSELFLTQTCGSIELKTILRKCTCHYVENRGRAAQMPEIKNCWKQFEFFYSHNYTQQDGSFIQADSTQLLPDNPPDNCPVCARKTAQDAIEIPQIIQNGHGVAFGGHTYHLNDCALAKSDGGPCFVGQVIGIKFSSKAREAGSCTISFQLFGRVRTMLEASPDDNTFQDEQELFMTEEVLLLSATTLLKPCKVRAITSLPEGTLHEYTSTSLLNFYIKWFCKKADLFHWKQRKELAEVSKILTTCAICLPASQSAARQAEEFKELRPLRAFDPFCGTGAFALSMQEAGALVLTHAVEISPSAATTLKTNSPDTIVYNQCANLVLENAVKNARGQHSTLWSIEEEELPPVIKPGDIDCLVAGFPCEQMTAKPKHCFFENVRGFIQYNLNATQQSKYRTKGGIQAGGLKFFVHALLTMGYQVRFALLEAAHYGTPQARVRFFLIASKLGHTLPSLPAPLYHIPTNDTLSIKLPHQLTITPVPPTSGEVPFRYISVDDAISDLPWFDWHNPLIPGEQPRTLSNGHIVPLKTCNQQKPTCGMSQPVYRHEPRTRFQQKARARQREVKDLQHYTRPLKDETIARPLQTGHTAVTHQQRVAVVEYELCRSEARLQRRRARADFPHRESGFYGRLDKDKWFHTTVTNVEPMAKQSWVLNPYCKRVVTVRELARSQGFPDHFMFCSVTDEMAMVKTMHREIGNAVPWPVGLALGRELMKAEFKDWLERKANAIVVDE
ncbi:hypothetical protein BC835DRAFT_1309374 [Cytidiella melzeri]|nr:hypothetical protein BC835DRAFT_1309374 [Cytidiella melzeri]